MSSIINYRPKPTAVTEMLDNLDTIEKNLMLGDKVEQNYLKHIKKSVKKKFDASKHIDAMVQLTEVLEEI